MIELHAFYGPTDWEWVRERVPMKRVEDTCGLVATNYGEIVAAIIFDNFLYSSAQVTIIIENPMVIRAGLLKEGFEFIFNKCSKERIYIMVAENNVKSLKLSEKLGFTDVMRIPEGYAAGVDFIVRELAKKNCKYPIKF